MGKVTKSNLSSNFMIGREGLAIYIDSEQGDDNNNGTTLESAVKTFERAVDMSLGRVYTQSQVSFFVKGVIYATPKTQLVSAIKVIHVLPYNYYTDYGNVHRPRMVIDTHNTFVFGALEEVNIYNFDIETADNPRGLFIYTCDRATINHCNITGANRLLSTEFSNVRMDSCVLNCTGMNSFPITLNSMVNLSMLNITFEPNSSTNVVLGIGSTVNANNGDPVNLIKGEDSLFFNDINRGIIVESGTNGNGNYYKYGNGLLICEKWTEFLDVNIPAGQAYDLLWDTPIVFIGEPFTSVTLVASDSSQNRIENVNVSGTFDFFNNRNRTSYIVENNNSLKTVSRLHRLKFLAIGRWK